ncbi:MAG: cytochrome C [Rhodobacteraceae bacterium]|nr:MAG: cytochrome C [Paracoccaceae bacterium]
MSAAWTAVPLAALLLAAATNKAVSDQVDQGQALYAETCASCHGANLEGQPDWRRRLDTGRMPAPPHDETGHTWHHSDATLFRITKQGIAAVVGNGYKSDMPGFENLLSDEEIRQVLDYIKSTWPPRAREAQVEITRSDRAASQ